MSQKPDKNQAKSRKIKSQPRSRHRQITAADLVKRLPLSKSLSASQATIVALSPLFDHWLNQPDQLQRLSDACRKSCFLSSFQSGQLTIVCPNASNASELKHLKASLQNHLNSNYSHSTNSASKNGTEAELISAVNIRIDLALSSQNSPTIEPTPGQRQSITISSNSINALNSCSKQVDDPQLAEALRRLAKTLENDSSAQ